MAISEDYPYVSVTLTGYDRRVETDEDRNNYIQRHFATLCLSALFGGFVLGGFLSWAAGPSEFGHWFSAAEHIGSVAFALVSQIL